MYILIIGCLLSAIGTVLVIQFSAMRKNLENISNSVGTLNIQIAEVIKDQNWHKEEIAEIKSELKYTKGQLSSIIREKNK